MNHPDWYLALTVGLLLGAALVAGLIARMLHLPRVTAYLLVGLLLGPHTPLSDVVVWVNDVASQAEVFAGGEEDGASAGFHLIPESHLHYLEPVSNFAMGLVLFNMGCHFPVSRFRRIVRRLLPISLGELGATMVLVTVGLLLLSWLKPDAGLTWQAAVLFGALALATAPATTVLVLKENRSEGPITEFTTGLVALNNLAAVVVFELLFVLVHATRGADVSITAEYLELTRDLGCAVLLGVGAGLATSFFCGMLPSGRWYVLLTAVIAPLMAVCELNHVPYLLTFLTMGATVASTSDLADDISESLDRLTGLLCVVFFVIHGAEMNIKLLWAVGSIGASYIALRCAGKFLGVWLTTDAHRDGPQVKRWLGAAMLSQAGAAIALSSIAVERDEQLGLQLQSIILGTVVFFEIAGPILVRTAVLRAGEVPVSDAILHSTNSPLEQIRNMAFQLMRSLGLNAMRGSSPEQLDVGRITRRNIKPLSAGALFAEVLDHIEHSRDNTYPVVNNAKQLIGVIRYPDVRDVMFEPTVQMLVTAEDLAVPIKKVLRTNESLSEAWKLLQSGRDDCVPVVVTGEASSEFIGIVRRRDLLRLLAEEGQNPQETS